MEGFWSILGLEPTKEVSAIRRAYAQQSRTCHPEEDPEGFLRLREAYQAALAYAENDAPAFELPEEADTDEELPDEEEFEEKSEDLGWGFAEEQDDGPNPFEDSEAIRQFLELYTGKQRKNPKTWLDYFTSAAFLDVSREPKFAQLLLEHITRLEPEWPVNLEFTGWLYTAYQFGAKKQVYRNPDGSERIDVTYQVEQGGRFEGLGFIFQIASKGPIPSGTKGGHRAMAASFSEYRRLIRMAEEGRWNEQDLKDAGKVLEYYVIGNFQEKNPTPSERHPAGMRLIEHFFRREDLPDELFRIAWEKLELKTAIMGRAKVLYGGLRERVLDRLPDVGANEVNARQLNRDFEKYRQSVRKLEESGSEEDWAQAGAETDAFFAREDFQKALRSRRFVEDQLLRYWLNLNIQWGGTHFVQSVQAFYEEHQEAPCAEQVVEQVQDAIRRRERQKWTREDQAASVPDGSPTLAYRPFLRHWLNTNFYYARDVEGGQRLVDYLDQELPWAASWSRSFLEMNEDGIPVPRCVTYKLGNDVVEVRFHLRFTDLLLNGELMYRPCLEWERVEALADTDQFCFLIPFTVTTYDRYDMVKERILARLPETAAPEDCRGPIASSLAGQVCCLPIGPDGQRANPMDVFPMELFMEDGEHLYGCLWMREQQSLVAFEQTMGANSGRTPLRDGIYAEYSDVPNEAEAVTLARQILEQKVLPAGLPLDALASLPNAVYGQKDIKAFHGDDLPFGWSKPVRLLGEAVTREELEKVLALFSEGKMKRLELSWMCAAPAGEGPVQVTWRSLVFMKEPTGYACLYFDDAQAQSYVLRARSETMKQLEREGPVFVPFGQSKLFSKDVHRSFASIQRQLITVFSQASRPNSVREGGIWDLASNVNHGRHKYFTDKQLLGGFPMERAQNSTDTRFYFQDYPCVAAWVDAEGKVEMLTIGETNRDRLQQAMVRFLEGAWPMLRLTWGNEPDERRHIILLHDGGRFQMAWVDEGKQKVDFHVADVRSYMDVEGKKYPKSTFQGRTVPTYLIHADAATLRSALEPLLARIDDPSAILNKFAEYAAEKPVKARPYEDIWAELVGGTGGAQ